MFWIVKALTKEMSKKEYPKAYGEWYIEFRNEEERMLFEKYLELWAKNWWSVIYKQIKWKYIGTVEPKEPYSAYDNVERVYVSIPWVKCIGTAKREWDDYWYWQSRASWRSYIFDVLDNEEAVKYIFNVAKEYQDKQDAIKKAEEDAEAERKRIEKEQKEEVIRIEKYVKRMNELDGSTWEFSEQFRILREIESIGVLNQKLLVSWQENVDKIHKLKKDFYKL